MDFAALDVETANSDLASICQIGVATFNAGAVVDVWHTLIDPEDSFDGMNISIHGIEEEHVKGSPKFPHIFEHLCSRLAGRVVVHHTHFDRVSLARVCEKYDLGVIGCRWVDTAKVARRAWPQFAENGYGLASIARTFGIEFRHHAAHEDARAAGEIFLRAISETGISPSDWLDRIDRPISLAGKSREGNPDGLLFGEVLVFTGSLALPRQRAADLAAQAGCDVASSVSKQTTLLIVGDQDVKQIGGKEKSTKHRKAEELISKGQAIRILCESDFVRLLRN
jgi:DNA polymerase-3 subunit epsilon